MIAAVSPSQISDATHFTPLWVVHIAPERCEIDVQDGRLFHLVNGCMHSFRMMPRTCKAGILTFIDRAPI